VPKTSATWADVLWDAAGSGMRTVPGGQVWFGLTCDDLRLVGLKLIFLVVTRAVSVLGLSRREAWWKDAEILMLRHRTLIWNLRHLMIVLREYEDFYNSHRPHRALGQAAPLRPLPGGVTDLDHFRVRRHDRVGGVIHEYRLVA
jgi:hypothetical protein